MSKFIDAIIDEVRESTENEEFDDTIGLSEEEIIRFINEAQNRLHSKIVATHPQVFTTEQEEDIVGDQESYSINFKSHLGMRIHQVDFSSTGNADDYYKLKRISPHRRSTGAKGNPSSYFKRGKSIFLGSTPRSSTGKLRITYIKKITPIDKRRSTIATINGTATAPTSLEINYVNGTTVDSTEIAKRTRITIVDKYGAEKMSNILLGSIDTSVGGNDALLTLDTSGWTPISGESITTSDFVISGQYGTTHFELEPEVERYIHAYVEWKMLKRDSSVDSAEAIQELGEMEADIIASYADDLDDIEQIPVINDNEDWGF